MATTLNFVIPFKAEGQRRPRFASARGGCSFFRVYKDNRDRILEEQIATLFRLQFKEHEPIKGAVKLSVCSEYTTPPSWTKKKTAEQGVFKTSKPDLTNIEKLIEDALNGLAWKDDAQVAIKHSRKIYGTKNLIRIRIREIKSIK